MQLWHTKKRIHKTRILSTCGDSRTDTKTDRKLKRMGEKSSIMCQVSLVTFPVSRVRVLCPVSPVTCHLQLTLTVTATGPPSANSPIMHSRLVRKD